MSFEDGWAAIHLEMPERIPHTEYSIESHWDLIRVVTGLNVGVSSPEAVRKAAGIAFQKAWNFDFFWNITIGGEEVEPWRTDMGHAEYAAGGTDRRDTIHCPFQDVEQVLAFDPLGQLANPDRAKLVRRFEADYTQRCVLRPFGVNMAGIYISLVSGLIELFGWEMLLLAAGTDPKRFGDLTDRYAAWIQLYFNALAEADVPVVMIHDDMVWTSGPIMRLSWYRDHIFPNLKKLIAPLVESGKRVIYTSDGDYSKFIDDVAACGVHGFVLEPSTNMEYMVERYGKTHVIIGNADTRILLGGTRAQIRAEVERCMRLGKNCPGYFMAVGNHIPANTPVENCLYYNEVYEELSRR
jgi:hypothetical protein